MSLFLLFMDPLCIISTCFLRDKEEQVLPFTHFDFLSHHTQTDRSILFYCQFIPTAYILKLERKTSGAPSSSLCRPHSSRAAPHSFYNFIRPIHPVLLLARPAPLRQCIKCLVSNTHNCGSSSIIDFGSYSSARQYFSDYPVSNTPLSTGDSNISPFTAQ
jgi:hypothetical protein